MQPKTFERTARHMRRVRPSASMMIALVALFVSLGGGAYAAVVLPANSVDTRQLHNDAITGRKVKPGLSKASMVAKGQLPRSGRASAQGATRPAGPQGPSGDTGATGPRGEQGRQGILGPVGSSSATWVQPTYYVLLKDDAYTGLAHLNVQPGAYAIQATAQLHNNFPLSTSVGCFLVPNDDVDEGTGNFATADTYATVPLTMTYTFARAGTIDVWCDPQGPSNVSASAGMTAIKVQSETH